MKELSHSFIDFHSHILPRADHGSDSLETTLSQLSFAKSFGVEKIIATPHFYPHKHNVSDFLVRRNNAYNLLLENMPSDFPVVRLGAEVLICNGIERLEGLKDLCIHGTQTLLLELPFADFQPDYYRSTYKLCSDGFNVILAHADRYPAENIKKMTDAGALIQLNASSLVKFFPAKHLFDWLDKELVVAIGSDIHMVDKSAYKRFVKAFTRLKGYSEYVSEQSEKIWNESEAFSIV